MQYLSGTALSASRKKNGVYSPPGQESGGLNNFASFNSSDFSSTDERKQHIKY